MRNACRALSNAVVKLPDEPSPVPGRDIGHARDLQIPFLHAHQLERFPDDGVLDFVDRGYFLQMGILQEKTIHKPAMNCDIDVFVDRGGDKEAARAGDNTKADQSRRPRVRFTMENA